MFPSISSRVSKDLSYALVEAPLALGVLLHLTLHVWHFTHRNYKNVCTICIIVQQWHGIGSWNISSCKTRTCLIYIVDTMGAGHIDINTRTKLNIRPIKFKRECKDTCIIKYNFRWCGYLFLLRVIYSTQTLGTWTSARLDSLLPNNILLIIHNKFS